MEPGFQLRIILAEVQSMSASANVYYADEQVVEEAHTIAWDFLKRSGAVRDEYQAQVFLAKEIMTLLDKGVRHKIKLANLAIAAFEKAYLSQPFKAAG
jgi:hypothetical protein